SAMASIFLSIDFEVVFCMLFASQFEFRIRVTRDKKERNDAFLGDFESFFYILPGLYEFL
ncbi:hypothetical protein, partial [Leptospira interrogans]